MKSKWLFEGMIVVFCLLSACGTEPAATPTPTTAQTATNTPVPPTATTTATWTPSPTFTPVPTLPANEAYSRIFSYLRNEPGCQLPCLFGITLEKSTMTDVRALQTILSGAAKKTYFPYTVDSGAYVASQDYEYSVDDKIIWIALAYVTSPARETVIFASLNTEVYRLKKWEEDYKIINLFNDGTYNKIFSEFRLQTILSGYGPPEKIFVAARVVYPGIGEPFSSDSFEIRLMYPEQGVFAIYRMAVTDAGEQYKVCPSSSWVHLDLLPRDLDTNAQESELQTKGWSEFLPLLSYHKTVDDAFGMTIQEFYEMFRLPTDRCLETPKSIWKE